MYIIHTGLHVTRRKQMNAITNGTGEPVWTGARIFDAFQWLVDNGVGQAILQHEERLLAVQIAPIPD